MKGTLGYRKWDEETASGAELGVEAVGVR